MNFVSKKAIFIPVALITGLLLIFVYVTRGPGGTLKLEVAPSTATITLDNKAVKVGSHSLSPGKHILTARMNGFGTVNKTFTIRDKQSVAIDILLNPNSEAGYTYLRNHPDEQLKREALGGKNFSQQTNQAGSKNPLIYELPFVDQLYRIDYGASEKYPNDPSATAIYITFYRPEAREDALKWIRFKGYDPDKLEIIFIPTGV